MIRMSGNMTPISERESKVCGIRRGVITILFKSQVSVEVIRAKAVFLLDRWSKLSFQNKPIEMSRIFFTYKLGEQDTILNCYFIISANNYTSRERAFYVFFSSTFSTGGSSNLAEALLSVDDYEFLIYRFTSEDIIVNKVLTELKEGWLLMEDVWGKEVIES